MADSDSHNISVSLLTQPSEDFFQESQDLLSDDNLLPVTNIITEHPLKMETCPKISLTCEEYLKDSTTDETTIDTDPTPDLEFTTTFRKCDKIEHTMCAHIDTADKSDKTHTTHVDSIKCNVLGCNISHTCAYNKETDNSNSAQYLTPTLNTFMESMVEIRGTDIIQQISYYKHKVRACEQKLIEEYNISPVIVKRWMDLL